MRSFVTVGAEGSVLLVDQLVGGWGGQDPHCEECTCAPGQSDYMAVPQRGVRALFPPFRFIRLQGSAKA